MSSLADRMFTAAGMPMLLRHFGIPVTLRTRRRQWKDGIGCDAVCDGIEESTEAETHREDEKERMWVTINKNYFSGMAALEVGDTLERNGIDASNARWAFTGTVRNESTESWDLLFERDRPTRYGPKL